MMNKEPLIKLMDMEAGAKNCSVVVQDRAGKVYEITEVRYTKLTQDQPGRLILFTEPA